MDDLVEIAPVQDVYADNFVDVELLDGGNVRLIFVAYHNGEPTIVAKIVMPEENLVPGKPQKIIAEKRRAMTSTTH